MWHWYHKEARGCLFYFRSIIIHIITSVEEDDVMTCVCVSECPRYLKKKTNILNFLVSTSKNHHGEFPENEKRRGRRYFHGVRICVCVCAVSGASKSRVRHSTVVVSGLPMPRGLERLAETEAANECKDRISPTPLRPTTHLLDDQHLKTSLVLQYLSKNEVDWSHSCPFVVGHCLFPGLGLPILVDGFGYGSQAIH